MTLKQEFERFLIPESSLSLKLVIDNIRNYLICGAALGMALWLDSGKATARPFVSLTNDGLAAVILASYAVFWVLLVLNACQSILIGRKAFGFEASKGADPRADWESHSRWYVNILVHVLAGALTIALMILIFALAMFALYFAWFAAIGGRG